MPPLGPTLQRPRARAKRPTPTLAKPKGQRPDTAGNAKITPSRTQQKVVKAWAKHPAPKRATVKPAPRLQPTPKQARRAAAPSPTRIAKAQEQQYRSQGRAVKQTAARQEIQTYL